MIIGFLLGCQNSSKTSFIILSVDHLSFQDGNCIRDWPEQNSGIGLLCRESVRWTHAYTTSLLSGPALASVLTGLHPRETGYRHHGQYLLPQHKSIAQIALQKNYRTAFFSGGPPILKKSGLDGGFELFDDTLSLSVSPFLKPFKESSRAFSDWLDDIGPSPFFATFYIPDLRYVTRTTFSPTGETRNKSYESQVEEFDTALFELFKRLKKENLWDKTHIILLGLQGRNLYDRQGDFPHLNLHSENSQVAVLWKPPQKKRDEPVSWTMDKNISLADIGRTLFDIFEEDFPESIPEKASLAISLNSPSSTFSSARLHLIESAWGQWIFGGEVESAILNAEEFYFHQNPPAIYRTLSDRLEINPILKRPPNEALFEKYDRIASELKLNQFSPPQISNLSLWSLGYESWVLPKMKGLYDYYSGVNLSEIPEDARVWYARALIENSDWKTLKAASEKWKKSTWLWLAHANLGLPSPKDESNCLKLVNSKNRTGEAVKKCADPLFVEALYSLDGDRKAKRWERILEERLTQVQILKTNRALGFIWDVVEKEENVLSLTEMLFWIPENRNLLRPVQRKRQLIDLESP